MLPRLVTTDVTNDSIGVLFLRVEIAQKNRDLREIGEGGIEFHNRDHSQIDGSRETVTLEEYTRGV